MEHKESMNNNNTSCYAILYNIEYPNVLYKLTSKYF